MFNGDVHGKITMSKMNDWLMVEPYPSEKYESVSWDDDIPNMEKWKMFQTTHQMNWLEQKKTYWKIRQDIDIFDIPFGNQTWRRLQNPLI